jgi:hypothetical protein
VTVAFGVRYLLTRQFMPYHAVISGRAWSELERGMQTAILGMLKVCGAGFLGYGAALLWLLVPLYQGERWAVWAILTVTAAMVLPIFYITLWLRRVEPRAKTPVVPTAIVLFLVLAGAVVSLA